MTEIETERTTAMGLWTDAKNMSEAARILRESRKRHTTFPAYFLLSRSIELILKSYLLATGDTLDFLKNKIRHNLVKASNRVKNNDSGNISKLLDKYTHHIELLNIYYQAKEFEYSVTGTKSLPRKHDLQQLLDDLIPLVRPLARKSLDSPPKPNA